MFVAVATLGKYQSIRWEWPPSRKLTFFKKIAMLTKKKIGGLQLLPVARKRSAKCLSAWGRAKWWICSRRAPSVRLQEGLPSHYAGGGHAVDRRGRQGPVGKVARVRGQRRAAWDKGRAVMA
ncbi:hypothetical protein GOP47_0018277 [Adiantum capillus-veneris]|uniref:Uncharacterized protein n=1 Tax=Adiantum capillus-veneris TaxID=13818 RepID=A0A9D4ZAG4_ADICA|nr:hypothetical protein GOP47_0018277 [Adiantum capillus-veneris]